MRGNQGHADMSASTQDEDFIDKRLGELRTQRRRITRTQWIAAASLVVLIAGLLAGRWWLDQRHDIVVKRLLAIETMLANRATVEAGQWRSAEFASGGHVCGPQKKKESRRNAVPGEKKSQFGADPCKTLVPTESLGSASHSLREFLRAPSSGPIFVVITGGHDRDPLRGALAARLGNNTQLAQARADEIRRALLKELEDLSDAHRRLVQFVTLPRSAEEIGAVADADRTVTVTVLRLGAT